MQLIELTPFTSLIFGSTCLFWISCQQHVSSKLEQGQQKTGTCVECSENICLEHSAGKQIDRYQVRVNAVSKKHSWEAHSFPSKVGPSISALSNVHLYRRRWARGFGNTGVMLVSLSVWGLYIGLHSFSILLHILNHNMLNPNPNRTSIHTLPLNSSAFTLKF